MITNYKGNTEIDVGYYLCLYRPGMNDEEIADVSIRMSQYTGPTEIQTRIMNMIRNTTTKE